MVVHFGRHADPSLIVKIVKCRLTIMFSPFQRIFSGMTTEERFVETSKLTPIKRYIFIAVTFSIPVIFIVCLEIGLRLFNYGEDVSLFSRVEIGRRTFYRENPDVKYRYFGKSAFHPSTSPTYFAMPKPAGVYRIFCLGGSTTVGYPYYYNGAFSTYLRDRLKAIFPQKEVEIINLGMTATSSYTALDIGTELARYQPDLIIDYDGHNEFYGALGAASNQTVGSSRFFTLLYLRMIHCRTFQLMRDGLNGIARLWGRTNDTLSRGTEMERLSRGAYVQPGSELYNKTCSIFRENLIALREYCRSSGIPLILGTQVSDLRDQPPFISSYSGNKMQDSILENAMKRGHEFENPGKIDSAIIEFQNAISIDSSHAGAHYRLARCYDEAGKKSNALAEYILARDDDELRFRTDSKFNDLIRTMADGRDCFVADMEKFFMTESPDSLIGHNLITEHLHPNSRGDFLIAKCYSEVMKANGLLATKAEWTKNDTIEDAELWGSRSITELDEQIAKQSTNVLTSGWPFKNQAPRGDSISPSDTIGEIAQQVVDGNLDWGNAHLRAINFYQRR